LAGPFVIGVDVGGTKILAGRVTREGEVERQHEERTPTTSEEALLAGLAGVVEELLDEDVVAVGFGIPSTIDQRTGTAVSSVNIPLTDVHLRMWGTERFGVPVGVDNDANAAALAEWAAGAGRGTRHMVMLTLGTGFGGGLVLDGRLYRGALGAAGELGHMVVEHDGLPCQGACTGRGHIEAYASGRAADGRAAALLGEDVGPGRLVGRARDGDEAARDVLADIGRRLGSAIGSLVNIFNPELVVIGGGFGTDAAELVLEPARAVVAREALPPARDLVRIVLAELGSEAGLVGAGLVGFEALDAGL
jgi:glucokinase